MKLAIVVKVIQAFRKLNKNKTWIEIDQMIDAVFSS